MGIVESRILANSLLSACNKAAEEGKHQLDESEFWKDTENIKASKSIYKHIPQRIRQTSRQSAIKKAIVRSSQQLKVPQIVQDLQDKRESLFRLYLPTSSEESSGDSSSTPQIAPFNCHVPTLLQPCPLADFYKLVVLCEHQEQLGKIRLRICYVAFFRLKNTVQPGSQYQYDDASMFIAHLIGDSGCEDSLSDIERRVRRWVGLGERYSLLANDLGGLGVLYLLPEDGGESIWTKELPKSAKRPRRVAMLNHLRQKGLPEEAQTRGLHALAEDEAAKVLGPIKASLDRVMESQLSEANAHIVDVNRQSNRTGSNWPQPDIPQSRPHSAGTPSSQPGAPVATQAASTVGPQRNIIYSGQATSKRVHYEPSLAQMSLQNLPDLMSQGQTNGLGLVHMPTESGSSQFKTTAMENSAQFDPERRNCVPSPSTDHLDETSSAQSATIGLKENMVPRPPEPTAVVGPLVQQIADMDFRPQSPFPFGVDTPSDAARLMDRFQLESMIHDTNASQLMQDFHLETFNPADQLNAAQLMQQFDWFNGINGL